MADPLSIIGVVGVVTQVIQIAVQFGLDWKDAPTDAKCFFNKLRALKTVLCETSMNMVLNQDFVDAFHGRHSMLLSQFGTAIEPTDTQIMLSACYEELVDLLKNLQKRGQGHRMGWERLKGAFTAKKTRETIENLQRQCQILNSMTTTDALTIGVSIHKEVKEARKEQQDWHDEEIKLNSVIKDGIDELHYRQDSREAVEERNALLDWLTPVDYASQQSDFISRRQEGTGQWLLDSEEFQEWIETDEQTLFSPGIPGAGKTILTSAVVEYLQAKFRKDLSVGIAYIYCNFRRQDEQKAEDLLASLLKQLAQSRSSLPEDVKFLRNKYKDNRTRPSLDEISKSLQSVAALYSRVFIIVDALDECQTIRGCRARFLTEIFTLQAKCGTNLLATSRFIPEIVERFDGSALVEIRANPEDVGRYVDAHISNLPSFVRSNPDLQDEIKTKIVKVVDGMYAIFLKLLYHVLTLLGFCLHSFILIH